MKKHFLFRQAFLIPHSSFLIGFALCFASLGAFAQESDLTLVWSDEFDGSGPIDDNIWSAERGFVRNHEDQWYQGQNAYRHNGVLILEGRPDSIPNPRYEAGSGDWKRNRPYAAYSSACIHTRGKYTFQYGRLEVRARIPAVCGAWPAIWTLGQSMDWPSNGEIDILEFYQVDGQPTILANYAWGNDKPWDAIWRSTFTPYSHFLEKDPDWAEKFHIWALDWDSTSLAISLDGEVLNRIDLSETVNGSVGNYSNPFRQPHYILLNLALGGDHGGPLQPDAFPMRYEVDYVRVYQRKP